jgi:hypothetical protein
MAKLTVAFRNFVKVSKYTVLWDVTLQSARNFPDIFLEMCGLYLIPTRRQTVRPSETSPLNHNQRRPEQNTVCFVMTALSTSTHSCAAASTSTAAQAAKRINPLTRNDL